MQAAASVVYLDEGPSAPSEADSEIEIVERARCDPTAFGVLYDRYFERIYRFVYSRVHERCLAEDITEEVFLKALKGIPNYRDTGACFSAWLYRIASNAIVSHYRRNKNEVDLEAVANLAAMTEGVLDAVVRRDRSRRIWEAIDRLPPRQREVMRLKFGADLPLEDVGRMMGKSSGAIKILVHRATQRLRRELVPLQGERGN
jgi:RNA polymerase sigma-70 factor (ECF subfamily)